MLFTFFHWIPSSLFNIFSDVYSYFASSLMRHQRAKTRMEEEILNIKTCQLIIRKMHTLEDRENVYGRLNF